MPVNTGLAKKQVATITATLCKSAALPDAFIDLDNTMWDRYWVLISFSQLVRSCKYKP